jgi:sugar/nucleoside kinase (ribokinase family)
VHATLPLAEDSLATLVKGSDVSTRGDIAALPGGTAWQFADALASSSDIVPLITATVGGDWAGDLLSSSLRDRGFPCEGVTRAVGHHTDIVVTADFKGRSRLMAWPGDKVSHAVRAWPWQRIADLVASHNVRFAWISGYLFEDRDPSIIEAARELFANLRERRIAIVLDLVPHEFSSRIGDLRWLELETGPMDVVVGEFATLLGLGFGRHPAPGEDVKSGMINCARSAAFGRVGAVAQQRLDGDVYSEAVVGQAAGERVISMPVPSSGPRGIGDALAVQALKALGLVS